MIYKDKKVRFKTDIDLINNLHQTGELKIKVYAMLSDNEENFNYFIDSIGKPLKTDKLNVRSFKFFADGSLGSRGACLLKPYSDQKTTNGMLLQKQELFAPFNPNKCHLGNRLFDNHTRQQTKDVKLN